MRRDELPLSDSPSNDRPGDRWMCGRGGDSPCPRGPGRLGRCPQAEPCRPQRTWHGRRKRWTTAGLVLVMLLCAAVAWDRWRVDIIKPGGLATPHAQILSGTMASDRCGTCHTQASTSVLAWFSADSPGHANVSQTDRCLQCHHTTIARPTATLAHNLPESVQANIRLTSTATQQQTWHDLMPTPAVDPQNIQCSTCHREHGGADNDLSAVSDAQCQTCHADRFGSFARAHPEWDNWPYGRGRSIAFNHSTHATRHFPAAQSTLGAVQFQCADCHLKSLDNELTRTVSYERACKSCHDQGLVGAASEGLELFAVPSLPPQSAAKIGAWPPQATGFFDGTLSPISQLLVRSDPNVELSLQEIPGADLAHINDADAKSVAAAERIANACRALSNDISTIGQAAVTQRLVQAGITKSTAASVVRSLPIQLIAHANQLWFQQATDEVAEASGTPASLPKHQLGGPDDQLPAAGDADDALLLPDTGDDLLLGDGQSDSDPLSRDPLVDPLSPEATRAEEQGSASFAGRVDAAPEFNPDQMLPEGAWYRDDSRLAIRYRGGQHADAVLKAIVELISELATSDPVRQQLLATPAVAGCIDCHPGAVRQTGAWIGQPQIGRRTEFTKFSHAPHLNIASLADCRHCHRIAAGSTATDHVTTVSATSHPAVPIEFEPISRQTCAVCHHADAAGDACVKCHRYHIDRR